MSDVIFTPTLADAFQQAGLPYPGEIEAGRIKRFSANGKKHDTAGWLKVFPDGDGAVFGCWRDGDASFTWQREREGYRLNRQEIDEARKHAEQARNEAQAEREVQYDIAALRATQTWQEAAKAASHAYLTTKQIQAHGARLSGDLLLVPVHDAMGNMQSLQTIADDGAKRFMSGGKMAGGRCWLGIAEPSGPVIICEGFATGATIHEVTGLPVAVAFNAGNLLAVAQSIHDASPEVQIVIAGDDDKTTPGNPGRTRATEAAKAVKGIVVFPEGDGCDFNDMVVKHGVQVVADVIRAALEPPPPRFKLLNRDDLRKLPELEWRIDNVLPKQGIGLIIGKSGAGKSFAAIDLLARVSLGLDWFGRKTKPCNTVYVALEGRAGIRRRIESWELHHDYDMPDAFAVVLDSLKLTAPEDVHELASAVLEAGGTGGLIVIDTMAQASPGVDENSSADMGLLIDGLQRLQALTDGLVIAVHHMGKDAGRGARGHSSLYAACDAVVAVSNTPQTISTHNEDGGKSKDAEPASWRFDLLPVDLHTTKDGRTISGAALIEMNGPTKAKLPKGPRGGNVKIVFDQLGVLLKEAGDIRPDGAPDTLPEGRPAIRLDHAIEKIGPQLPVKPGRHTERVRGALTSLINNQLIEVMDGWLWSK